MQSNFQPVMIEYAVCMKSIPAELVVLNSNLFNSGQNCFSILFFLNIFTRTIYHFLKMCRPRNIISTPTSADTSEMMIREYNVFFFCVLAFFFSHLLTHPTYLRFRDILQRIFNVRVRSSKEK